jgi:membrane dipeptidase
MERNRMVVDLAHLNRKGFLEAMTLVRRPVMVSHTGISEVHPLWRNIDREQIRAVADAGGIIGVIFYPGFLTGRSRCTVDAIVDHLDAVRQWGGIDTPALGSDFDGCIPSLPDDLPDVASLPRLTEALFRGGFREDEIRKVMGENALRVLTEVCG